MNKMYSTNALYTAAIIICRLLGVEVGATILAVAVSFLLVNASQRITL